MPFLTNKIDLKSKLLAFFQNDKTIICLWAILIIAVALKSGFKNDYSNNYLIFKYTYFHASDHSSLYDAYPKEYQDTNHYGPFFSLFFAPFALLPNYIGMIFWQITNVAFLYFAIKQLPVGKIKINIVYWLITHEMLTAMFSYQFNISIAATIILAYSFILKEKNFWAVFVIMFGTFIKLYSIVGLAFFFFAKQKPKFILYCIFWAIVFFIMPMLFFSPSYIVQCYQDWYVSLSEKQLLNASLTSMQDISVMGMFRRILQDVNLPNLPFLIVGLILYAVPFLRIKEYKNPVFRLMILASTLIFLVIFSNSSESPTYIIAFCGVAIWFIAQEKLNAPYIIALLVFAVLLTSLSPSDLFPKFIKETYIKPYSLKALPCIIIWLVLTYQLIFKKFINLKTEEIAVG